MSDSAETADAVVPIKSEPKKGAESGGSAAVEEGHYDAEDIKKLEFPEAIRKRPGMYVGGANENCLLHCVYEAVDNSVDEAMAGHCKLIKVQLYKDGSIAVED